LAAQAAGRLTRHGTLMCEFGDGQEKSMGPIFAGDDWARFEVMEDMNRTPRFMSVRKS